MSKPSRSLWIVVSLLSCSMILLPITVNAEGEDSERLFFSLLLACGEFLVIPAGLVGTAGSLYFVAEEEKSSEGWKVMGYLSGAVNVGWGIAWLIIYEAAPHDTTLGLALGNLALGAIDIGFTIWASSQPEKPEQKITLAPMIIPDSRGNAAFGVGLQLVNW